MLPGIDTQHHLDHGSGWTSEMSTVQLLRLPLIRLPLILENGMSTHQKPFGNWTQAEAEHSQMLAKCSKNRPSTIYWMDVGDDGKFFNSDVTGGGHGTAIHPRPLWDILQEVVNLACHLYP